jgi:hypothetical protein
MRTCPQCGAQVGDTDDFCGNCGNYLGWGVKAAESGATAPVLPGIEVDDLAEPLGPVQAEPGRTTGSPRTAEPDRTTEPGRAAGSGTAAGPGRVTGPGKVAEPGKTARLDNVAGPGKAAEPGRTVRPGEVAAHLEADPAGFGPVLPGRPEARRPLPSTAVAADVDGPACPVCGTHNPPGRRFCRRCATPLQPQAQERTAARKRGWRWRGDRSRWLRRLAWSLVAVAVVVAGVVFWPRAGALWEDLRDRFASPVAVRPASTSSSAAVPDHPAANAIDGFSNRYWGAPDIGDSIEFTFAGPFRLLSVVVNSGAAPEEDAFVAEARPTGLSMIVTAADGATTTVPITLADEPGPQRTDTGVSDVVRIRLVVTSAAGFVPGKHIALGEVEFFRRS